MGYIVLSGRRESPARINIMNYARTKKTQQKLLRYTTLHSDPFYVTTKLFTMCLPWYPRQGLKRCGYGRSSGLSPLLRPSHLATVTLQNWNSVSRLTAAGQRLIRTAFPFNHQNGTSWQTIIGIFLPKKGNDNTSFFKCGCKITTNF